MLLPLTIQDKVFATGILNTSSGELGFMREALKLLDDLELTKEEKALGVSTGDDFSFTVEVSRQKPQSMTSVSQNGWQVLMHACQTWKKWDKGTTVWFVDFEKRMAEFVK